MEKKTGMADGSQMRITPDEIQIIRQAFKNNEALLKVVRKVFLPEFDPNAPLGQLIDLWQHPQITSEAALLDTNFVNFRARGMLINHLDMCLMQLKVLAEKDPNEEKVTGDNSTR